jgi:hypothetical protein
MLAQRIDKVLDPSFNTVPARFPLLLSQHKTGSFLCVPGFVFGMARFVFGMPSFMLNHSGFEAGLCFCRLFSHAIEVRFNALEAVIDSLFFFFFFPVSLLFFLLESLEACFQFFDRTLVLGDHIDESIDSPFPIFSQLILALFFFPCHDFNIRKVV